MFRASCCAPTATSPGSATISRTWTTTSPAGSVSPPTDDARATDRVCVPPGPASAVRLPLPDGVGQVCHPLRRLRADRLQGHATRVHAREESAAGAEHHGRQLDRAL